MAKLLTRIGFIDETSVKTNLAKTTGWAPRGARLVDHAPFGHWHTQTFIAALRHDRLDAPWVIDGPINRDLFDLYIETRLAPTLQPGDVIILDNLSSHKSPKAAQFLKDVGAWFLSYAGIWVMGFEKAAYRGGGSKPARTSRGAIRLCQTIPRSSHSASQVRSLTR